MSNIQNENAIQKIIDSVVKIKTSSGSGTGFYLNRYNLIATNHHVVSGYTMVAAQTRDSETTAAKVVLVNPLLDLALLEPQRSLSDLPAIKLGNSESVELRDKVTVLGYPFGMPFTVTEGIVSSRKQLVSGIHFIQTDAAINPGNSGGPVVNSSGDVIGIATAKFTDADNIGFALPVEHLVNELNGFNKQKKGQLTVKCPSCGFNLSSEIKYCQNCGIGVDTDILFKEKKPGFLASFIENCLTELELDPIIARNGPDYWEFYYGSALIRIFIYKNDFLYVISPLVKLPPEKPEQIYRYLLSDPVTPFSFGIDQNTVYMSYRTHLADINTDKKEWIHENIVTFILKANKQDTLLISEYGSLPSDDTRENRL